MPQFIGTTPDGDVWANDDGSTFTIPANVFGAGAPAPDIRGEVPPGLELGGPPAPIPGMEPPAPSPQPLDPYAEAPPVTPAQTATPPQREAMSYQRKTQAAPMGMLSPSGAVEDYSQAIGLGQEAEQQAILEGSEAAAKEQEALRGAKERTAQYGRGLAHMDAAAIDRDAEISRRNEAEVGAALDNFMNQKIDNQRYGKTLSDGQRAASIIAVGLGGFLAPLRGGKNPAMEMIERSIERDIESQKEDLANQRAGIAAKMSLFGQVRERMSSDRAAHAAVSAIMLKNFGEQAEAEAMQYGDEQIRARGQQMAADAYMKANDKQLEARKFEVQERNKMAMDAEQLKIQRYNAGTARRAAEAKGEGGDVFGIYGPDGKLLSQLNTADPNNKDRAKQANNEMRSRHLMDLGMQELDKLYAEGANITDPVARARVEAQAGDVILAIKQANALGAYDKGVEELAKKMGVGKVGWFYQADNVAALRQTRKANRANLTGVARSVGVPGDAMVGYGWEDPRGRAGAEDTGEGQARAGRAPAPQGIPGRATAPPAPYQRPRGAPQVLPGDIEPEPEVGLPPIMQYEGPYDPEAELFFGKGRR